MHDIFDIKEGPKYHEDTTLSGRVIIMQSFCFQRQTMYYTTVGQFEPKNSKNCLENYQKNLKSLNSPYFLYETKLASLKHSFI